MCNMYNANCVLMYGIDENTKKILLKLDIVYNSCYYNFNNRKEKDGLLLESRQNQIL